MNDEQTYPCCKHCPDDDPEYHAENPADSHDTSCSTCDRETLALHLGCMPPAEAAAQRAEWERAAAERAWRVGYFTGKRDYTGSITSGQSMSTPNPYTDRP